MIERLPVWQLEGRPRQDRSRSIVHPTRLCRDSRLESLERADAEERRCYIRINQSELAFGKMHSILKEEGGDGECGMEGTCVAHKWRPRPRMFLAYSFASLSPVAPSSAILTLAHRNQQRRRCSECWMEGVGGEISPTVALVVDAELFRAVIEISNRRYYCRTFSRDWNLNRHSR